MSQVARKAHFRYQRISPRLDWLSSQLDRRTPSLGPCKAKIRHGDFRLDERTTTIVGSGSEISKGAEASQPQAHDLAFVHAAPESAIGVDRDSGRQAVILWILRRY
jgi:hypothetical protein